MNTGAAEQIAGILDKKRRIQQAEPIEPLLTICFSQNGFMNFKESLTPQLMGEVKGCRLCTFQGATIFVSKTQTEDFRVVER